MEFTTKQFATELQKQGYAISPRTLEEWRTKRDGKPPKFPAGRYNRKGRVAVYFDSQISDIKSLLKKKKSPEDVAVSLFGGLADDTFSQQTGNNSHKVPTIDADELIIPPTNSEINSVTPAAMHANNREEVITQPVIAIHDTGKQEGVTNRDPMNETFTPAPMHDPKTDSAQKNIADI